MSIHSNGDDKMSGLAGAGAASASAGLQGQAAPKLRSGANYAPWRQDMEVYLARVGVESVLSTKRTADEWRTMVRSVEQWRNEDELEALASIGIGNLSTAAPAGSSTAASAGGATAAADAAAKEKEKRMRGVVTRLVELSTRAYGVIYSALPDDLKLQATKGADVPANFAYGLWNWLERKFQSTELDNIGNLLDQWTSMRQGEDESFDAYLARVNQLRCLLEHAGEKPSHNMYAYTLLWKLQPRYNVAVLTLKAQRHLDKADQIDWSHVSAFINGFERDMVRFQSGDGVGASAAAAWTKGGGRSGSKGKNASDKGKQGTGASKSDSTSASVDGSLRTLDMVRRAREAVAARAAAAEGGEGRFCKRSRQRARTAAMRRAQGRGSAAEGLQLLPLLRVCRACALRRSW